MTNVCHKRLKVKYNLQIVARKGPSERSPPLRPAAKSSTGVLSPRYFHNPSHGEGFSVGGMTGIELHSKIHPRWPFSCRSWPWTNKPLFPCTSLLLRCATRRRFRRSCGAVPRRLRRHPSTRRRQLVCDWSADVAASGRRLLARLSQAR